MKPHGILITIVNQSSSYVNCISYLVVRDLKCTIKTEIRWFWLEQ